MSQPPELVTAGGTRIDYLITRQGVALLGLLGGNALYSAVGCALWSEPVGIWSRIGANFPGRWLNDLAMMGFRTDGLCLVEGAQEHRTFYAYTRSGRREDTDPAMHFAAIGQPMPAELDGYVNSTPGQDDPASYEPLALRPEDWPGGYDGCRGVHLGPISIRTHGHVPSVLRERGVPLITVDPGERYMQPRFVDHISRFLPDVDAFLPSLMEVQTLFGPNVGPREAARRITDWGARMVAIKAGARGVFVLDSATGLEAELRPYHRPGDHRIVDVTGAGDAFCGGFLAGLSETGDAIRAVLMGQVSASLVLEGHGALYALSKRQADARPRLVELEERLCRPPG
jgi:sugar/nucleoside kinase (ribokinase family)